MSLDVSKLEKVRDFAGGKLARCPACAEAGQDRTGEHLRIYPDGKFGCCVFPKDREHRKRIFALAGLREQKAVKVRVVARQNEGLVKKNILGRIGQTFSGTEKSAEKTRTPRTGQTKSEETFQDDSRTGRTPPSPLTRGREKTEESIRELKEFEEGVRSVRDSESSSELETGVRPVRERLPYFASDGTLVIPFDSPERYHWWKGGQSVAETRKEVLERQQKEIDGAAL